MQTEEKLISPFVTDIRDGVDPRVTSPSLWITTALGEWFQSYETTIAFKGEFGVLINKDWYEGDRSKTTSKYLAKWLGEVERPFVWRTPGSRNLMPPSVQVSMKDVHARVKSGEYKLAPLTNYTQHPTPNTQ